MICPILLICVHFYVYKIGVATIERATTVVNPIKPFLRKLLVQTL